MTREQAEEIVAELISAVLTAEECNTFKARKEEERLSGIIVEALMKAELSHD